ncbi:MAG: hypothetical protein ACOVOV_04665, partial [Dolichospermum sp.]
EKKYYNKTEPTLKTGYVAGDLWYITPLGTEADSGNATAEYRFTGTKWVKTPGGIGKTQAPELVPVRDFKTQSELDTLASASTKPNDGTSYIVSDGANKSNIFTWDEYANGGLGGWVQYIPANDNITTMTNPGVEANAGKWSYDATTDTWIQIETGIELPDPEPQPVSVQNIALTRQDSYLANKNGGPILIVNGQLATYGDDTLYSAGDQTANGNLPRKLSSNWSNCVDGNYTKSAQYPPFFVDASQTSNYVIGLDHLGKLWAMGNQQVGTGMCTTPTGTTAVTRLPVYGLSPIGFFQVNNIVISKIYTSGVLYNIGTNAVSAALSNDNKLYVTGGNAWGQLADGTTTNYNNWKLYPISNVKEVKLSARGIFTLTISGDLYYSGYKDNGWINGVVGNQTTPLLISSSVANFDFGHYNGFNIYVVRNNNTLWVAGLGTSGQLGLGNLNNIVPLTQVPGLTNVKKVFANKWDGVNSVILKTDGSISCAGNNRNGMLAFTGATSAANYSTYFTPSFSAQGTITDVIVGYFVTTILTSTGNVWNSGQFQWRGLFTSTNLWADCNKFQQVALPEAVLGIRGFHEVTNNYDGLIAQTTNYGIIGYGSIVAVRVSPNTSYCYSPRIITELYSLNNGVKVSSPPALASEEVGSITGATASTVTDIVDGVNGQTVTFKVNYTGGVFGTLPITASVTGADVTQVALLTTSVVIMGTTGTFDVQFTINAADITALVPPNTQAQNYVLTLNT